MDRVAAVIFDLDGTLVDSSQAYFAAEQQALAHFGHEGFTEAEHRSFLGVGMRDMWEAVIARKGMTASVEELLERSNELYVRQVGLSVSVFPPVVSLARNLREAGVKVAVASGSSREVIRTVLSATGLASLFPVRVSAEEVRCGKPDPAVFEEASRRLCVEARRCAVVEDASPGVEAALRAGMRCVAVTSEAADAHPEALRSRRLLRAEHAAFDERRVRRWITGRQGHARM